MECRLCQNCLPGAAVLFAATMFFLSAMILLERFFSATTLVESDEFFSVTSDFRATNYKRNDSGMARLVQLGIGRGGCG